MPGRLQGFPAAARSGHAAAPPRPERAYLDHNASSRLRPEVRDAILEAMSRTGNPSSIHAEGRAARVAIERARAQVAALVGAEPEGVVFTSGGTEANNAALRPGALASPGGTACRLLVASVEHPSALDGHSFAAAAIERLPVDREGVVDLAALRSALDRSGEGPALVSLQMANSETGVLQPVAEVAALVRARGGVLHSDAVQAAGRVPIRMSEIGLDALSLSGHKLGGPAGIGALVTAPDREGPNLRLLSGGAQERRRRAGTENVAGIVGLGLAAELAAREFAAEAVRLGTLRDRAESEILRLAPDAVVFGTGTPRLPNTLAFAVPGIEAATVLMALDLDGVAVSSGSACTSGKVGRSHVLTAMGVPAALAACAIRLSLGWDSSAADIDRFAAAFENLLRRLYEVRRARAA